MLTELLGLVLLFLIMIVQVIVPPIPAEVIVIVAGNRYGIILAALVSGSGLWAGSYLVYLLGKYLRNRFSRFFQRENVDQVIQRLREQELLLLWVRVLPYNPSDVISYAAGIIEIPRKRFILITFFTSYIRCLLLTLLGERIRSLKHVFIVLTVLIISAIVANIIVAAKKRR
ncbi:MAG: TVP38/TMEM64 family protein [Desulfovibrionales bacterium]